MKKRWFAICSECDYGGRRNDPPGLAFDCPECGGIVRTYTEVKCCGRWVECHGFTTTCERCGADYDSGGGRLAPREQWGEETGEHPADIGRIP